MECVISERANDCCFSDRTPAQSTSMIWKVDRWLGVGVTLTLGAELLLHLVNWTNDMPGKKKTAMCMTWISHYSPTAATTNATTTTATKTATKINCGTARQKMTIEPGFTLSMASWN